MLESMKVRSYSFLNAGTRAAAASFPAVAVYFAPNHVRSIAQGRWIAGEKIRSRRSNLVHARRSELRDRALRFRACSLRHSCTGGRREEFPASLSLQCLRRDHRHG